jgi:hypothetical protein
MQLAPALLAVVMVAGCRGPQAVVRDDPSANDSSAERDAALDRVEAALAASAVRDATVVVGRGDGPVVVFVKGAGGVARDYHADSAQKWILATLLLRDARRRGVGLEQPLSTWPSAPARARGDVGATTQRGLLSFTAGFEDPPLCARFAVGKDFAHCLPLLVSSPVTTPRRYFYGTHQMMIALGALSAGDGDADPTAALLQRFRDETGLLATAHHEGDKPLALTITPGEYAAFLQQLSTHRLLTPDDEAAMLANQVGDREIAMSPADEAVAAGDVSGRWRYGLGNWIRCDEGQGCDSAHHSAGARGFYPFVDVDSGVFGVIAHNARVGAWTDSHALFEAIRADLDLIAKR